MAKPPTTFDGLPPEIVYQIVDHSYLIYATVSRLSKYHKSCTELSYTHILKKEIENCFEGRKKRERVFKDTDLAFRIFAERGNLRVLKICWKLGVKNPRTKKSWALRSAASNGHFEIVKYLIEEVGMGIKDVRENNNEVLRMSCLNGHLDILKYITSLWPDKPYSRVNIYDIRADDNFALRQAVKHGYFDIVKYLLNLRINDQGLEIRDVKCWNNYILKWASHLGHFEIIKYIISGPWTDVKPSDRITVEDISSNRHGWIRRFPPALAYALMYNHLDIVRYFTSIIEADNVDLGQLYYFYVLSRPSVSMKVVKYLIEEVPEPYKVEEWVLHKIVLFWAGCWTRTKLLQYLVEKLQIGPELLQTALIKAVKYGRDENIKILRKAIGNTYSSD